MTEPTKVGILGASLETPNLGVSALAVGAVGCIVCSYPRANVFFLEYARGRNTHKIPAGPLLVHVPVVNIRFSWKFWLPNNIAVLLLLALCLKLIPFRGLRQKLIEGNSWLYEICSADMFASVAGGDSFSDLYGLIRFIYIALPQLLVLLLRKRLVLLPQTYGPFRGKVTRRVARWIVAHAEQAWCRDNNSLQDLMRGLHAETGWGKGNFGYDMAFAIDPIAPARLSVEGLSVDRQSDAHLIGFNISGLLFQGGYTGRNEFGLRTEYKALVYAIIDVLLSREDRSVLLVPHVYGNEQGSESDEIACQQVFAKLRARYPSRIGILRGTYNPNEIRYAIGLCGFFIGSRMHACIAALSQNIPTVAIAYSDKFFAVMRSAGIGGLVADARKLDQEQILSTIAMAMDTTDVTARELTRIMPAIRETVWHLLNPSKANTSVEQPMPTHC